MTATCGLLWMKMTMVNSDLEGLDKICKKQQTVCLHTRTMYLITLTNV